MNIAERIVERLEALGLTKKELSNLIGVPNTTLHNWLIFNDRIPASHIITLANALEVDPVFLLTGEDKTEIPHGFIKLTETEQFLIDTVRALDREGEIVVTNKAIEELRRVRSTKTSSAAG